MFGNNTSQFEQCPKCSSKNAQEVRFTWWGGAFGPKMFNHVKCQTCGQTYDGETGKDNNTKILLYFIATFVGTFLLLGALNFSSIFK